MTIAAVEPKTFAAAEVAEILGVPASEIPRFEADGVLLGFGPPRSRRFSAHAVEVARRHLRGEQP